jgi:hypothetical protein
MPVPQLSLRDIAFLAANALIGLAVGVASARSSLFQTLQIPAFAWLVAGMFLLELIAGLVLKMHPATMVSMPLRVAALVVSFLICYVVLAALKAA